MYCQKVRLSFQSLFSFVTFKLSSICFTFDVKLFVLFKANLLKIILCEIHSTLFHAVSEKRERRPQNRSVCCITTCEQEENKLWGLLSPPPTDYTLYAPLSPSCSFCLWPTSTAPLVLSSKVNVLALILLLTTYGGKRFSRAVGRMQDGPGGYFYIFVCRCLFCCEDVLLHEERFSTLV